MEFLKEKSRKEMDCRRDELEITKKEIELREREVMLKERKQSGRERKDERIVTVLAEQQRQQHVLIAQLQQQMQAILALIGQKIIENIIDLFSFLISISMSLFHYYFQLQ